jgi:hypothetical protein
MYLELFFNKTSAHCIEGEVASAKYKTWRRNLGHPMVDHTGKTTSLNQSICCTCTASLLSKAGHRRIHNILQMIKSRQNLVRPSRGRNLQDEDFEFKLLAPNHFALLQRPDMLGPT